MWVAKSLLQKVNSKYNGEILVYRQFGRVQMEVGGLLQSGGVLKNIWRKALKNFNSEIRLSSQFKILILGLGGGSLAQLVSKKWPEAQITGVEIDPQVIKIAKDYFDLDKSKNLKVINQDAFKFIHTLNPNSYNLILVDLYQGEKFPDQAQKSDFFKQLKTSLTADGIVVFNHLFWDKHKKRAEKFIKKLESIFDNIKLKKVLCNLMIYCS